MVHVVFVFLVVFVFKIDKKYYLQVCFRRIQVAYQRKKKIERMINPVKKVLRKNR